MAIESLIEKLIASLDANTAAIQANGGNAAVAGTTEAKPAAKGGKKASVDLLPGDAEGTRYWDVVGERVAKTGPGEEGPAGAKELKGKDFTAKEAEYTAKNAAGAAAGAAATAQGQAAGATGAQTGGTATDSGGPSFQDVTTAITALSKTPETGRSMVVGLLAKWGVDTFPKVSGKFTNAQLLADIADAAKPATKPAGDDMSALGL